jgi:hypothetical protein
MTTPPDFGGTEFEEGRQEDLGVKAPWHEHDPDPAGLAELEEDPHDDNELQAPGQTCGRCGKQIQPGEDVRERPDGTWVHDVCPLV